MSDLGNKVMESMFDAWCDDECKEFTPDHNDYGHSLQEVVDYISELTGASREQKYRIEHELEDLVNRTEMTQNVNIAVKTESGQVKKISHGVIFQPETQFKGGTIKWFDDSKLIKPEYRK